VKWHILFHKRYKQNERFVSKTDFTIGTGRFNLTVIMLRTKYLVTKHHPYLIRRNPEFNWPKNKFSCQSMPVKANHLWYSHSRNCKLLFKYRIKRWRLFKWLYSARRSKLNFAGL